MCENKDYDNLKYKHYLEDICDGHADSLGDITCIVGNLFKGSSYEKQVLIEDKDEDNS